MSVSSSRRAQHDRFPVTGSIMSGAISASGPHDEFTLAEARVRNRQSVFGDGGATVENQIQIERPRRHRIGPRPSPLFFDIQQAVQQIARRQRRPSHDARHSDRDRVPRLHRAAPFP